MCGQYNRWGYGDTKSHRPRNIPIPKAIENELNFLKQRNPAGFLFSYDGGTTPVGRNIIYRSFSEALKHIGITEQERKSRNLSMHGWRHFFNTMLMTSDINASKVRSVTGHASDAMTEHYTHYDTSGFAEVVRVQEKLLYEQEKSG